VFITAGPITKLFAGGGRRRVEDMCYERRRAEACVDESAHHALANAGGREIIKFGGITLKHTISYYYRVSQTELFGFIFPKL